MRPMPVIVLLLCFFGVLRSRKQKFIFNQTADLRLTYRRR